MRPKASPRHRSGATARSPRRAPVLSTCLGSKWAAIGALSGNSAHHSRLAAESCQLQPQASRLLERIRSGTVLNSSLAACGCQTSLLRVPATKKVTVLRRCSSAELRFAWRCSCRKQVIRGDLKFEVDK